ncbi:MULTISPECIES: hypothetical protein [Mesoflavibacter]|uniref:NHL repeat containing protein n=1 Tax=Mesoflavibacter profundi TaxID=2708110 RepID=A0ABT4RXH3_9FLAO|nr:MULTISPECIES: hypothetical protein [Mesoflavibacter]MDA0176506.1 hypothetical protein [Mesoflavibacter profundi]QIJ90143.1 hypothetical protein C7H62_2335 [Mesoflavibacter sp. HG96]QIJ92871.1 hypothetical protein C7H56_2335 [Mesoflavibacter sp. HG37]
MKTKNVFKLLSICALTFTTLSCSDDDTQPIMEEEDQTSVRLFTSNNSDGNISILDVTNMSNVQSKTLITTSTAADGVYYDASTDAVFQASRSNLNLEGFYNVDMLLNNTTASIDISSTTDMESPREVAVNGDYYVVADNSDVDGDSNTPDGRLFVYQKTSNNFVLRNTITTNFKLWGIVFSGADLYAIVDTTDQLAVFNNFLSNTTDQTLMASKTISIEGIVRTHGIALDGNTMVLTDIGVASGTGTSATDGAFHIISDFSSKFNNTANGGTLALSEQVRVEGSSTLLGNPVDVAYDATTNTVFIAEAANGKILAFNNIGSGGNLSPVIDYNLASASAVYLSK